MDLSTNLSGYGGSHADEGKSYSFLGVGSGE